MEGGKGLWLATLMSLHQAAKNNIKFQGNFLVAGQTKRLILSVELPVLMLVQEIVLWVLASKFCLHSIMGQPRVALR